MQYIGGSRGHHGRSLGPIFFIFMQFSEKIGQKYQVSATPLPRLSSESLIRHRNTCILVILTQMGNVT